MTYDDFRRIPELRKNISAELMAVENAREQATSITSHITGMPRGGGGGSQIENAVIRADVHYGKYCELVGELREIYVRLMKEYIKLNVNERTVIDMFYPQERKIAEIARAMELTERQVFRIKKEAMAKLCAPSVFGGLG